MCFATLHAFDLAMIVPLWLVETGYGRSAQTAQAWVYVLQISCMSPSRHAIMPYEAERCRIYMFVSHRVGLRVYDPGFIPSSLTYRLVRTGLSAHNASRRRYRSQFP
jgi:hypothetical protein